MGMVLVQPHGGWRALVRLVSSQGGHVGHIHYRCIRGGPLAHGYGYPTARALTQPIQLGAGVLPRFVSMRVHEHDSSNLRHIGYG
jgi:hypothetical protein